MSSAATALQLLKQFAAEGQEITEDEDNIIFADKGSFPKNLPTGLKTTTKTEGYTLQALVFFHQQDAENRKANGRKLGEAETAEFKREFMNRYLSRCAKENVAAVQFVDYDFVVGFIAGKETGGAGSLGGSMETGDTDRVQAVHEKLQDPTTSIEFQAMKNETVPINRITAMTVQGINFSEHHLRVEDDINRAWYGRLKHKGERERANATSGKPIIVVPAASSSIITIYNCKSFLQDTSFVPPAEARKAHKGPPPPLVEVEHTFSSGQTLKFEVFNSYASIPGSRRRDVVCVFVHGPEWQFKGWDFASISEIFTRHECFHLKFKGDRVHANVAKWTTVTPLEIGKTNRATDQAVRGKRVALLFCSRCNACSSMVFRSVP
eukprot:INCI9711.2.p1 GENE.INCI9711.2~~INCI9711.2.p1  ORF type:complete len:379 (+),score=62.77 INCI9711.2:93-1229(+)